MCEARSHQRSPRAERLVRGESGRSRLEAEKLISLERPKDGQICPFSAVSVLNMPEVDNTVKDVENGNGTLKLRQNGMPHATIRN